MTADSTFVPPTVDWGAAAPVLCVMLAAVVGVLVEAFAPRQGRRRVQLAVAMLGLLPAIGLLLLQREGPSRAVLLTDDAAQSGIGLGMVLDPLTVYLQLAVAGLGLLSLLLLADRGGQALDAFAAAPATKPESSAERAAERAGRQSTEIFPLTLFAIGGMMIFCAAADLLTAFVALEVFSLPLYILCGLSRHQRLRSQEASLKYFLLGAFSSAIFLFGLALIYGATATVNISALARTVGSVFLEAQRSGQPVQWDAMVVLAVLMLLTGLLFKVGAVPFHSWTPDVYEGAPTPVTAFMAACTKVAAFGLLLRLMLPPVPTAQGLAWPGVLWLLQANLRPALIAVAAVTMVVGSAAAIRQSDVKRMLAYSAVAHAGFILVGLVSFQVQAISSVLFYLVVYGLSSIAAFGIVSLVRVRNDDGSIGPEARALSSWDGLGRRSPLLAAGFSVLMLAFAGFPLTSGFIAKFGVFSAAVASRDTPLVALAVLGVMMSAVAASFYLRVIVRMYFTEPSGDSGTVVLDGGLTGVAVAIGVAATLLLGLFPSPLLDAAGILLALR